MYRDMGSVAADEEAEPAATPHRSHRVVDERGEWYARRNRLPGPLQGPARESRADARIRQRPAASDRIRVHRQRLGPDARQGDPHVAAWNPDGPNRRHR